MNKWTDAFVLFVSETFAAGSDVIREVNRWIKSLLWSHFIQLHVGKGWFLNTLPFEISLYGGGYAKVFSFIRFQEFHKVCYLK